MFTAKSNIFCSGISIYLLILGINTSWYDFKRQWLKFYINLKYCLAICILFSCELYVTMSVCIYNERQLILQPFCKQVGMLIGYKEFWSSASFGTILCHDIWMLQLWKNTPYWTNILQFPVWHVYLCTMLILMSDSVMENKHVFMVQ